jgi:hypothetical protein
MRLLPFLLLAAGCAATGTGDAPSRDQLALTEDLAGRTAGAPQACVPIRQSQSMQIVDRQTLVYRDSDTIWVNRLGADCPGMRPLSTLIIEAHGSQYCRGDRVRAVETQSAIPGPTCVLRDFVPYRRGGGA